METEDFLNGCGGMKPTDTVRVDVRRTDKGSGGPSSRVRKEVVPRMLTGVSAVLQGIIPWEDETDPKVHACLTIWGEVHDRTDASELGEITCYDCSVQNGCVPVPLFLTAIHRTPLEVGLEGSDETTNPRRNPTALPLPLERTETIRMAWYTLESRPARDGRCRRDVWSADPRHAGPLDTTTTTTPNPLVDFLNGARPSAETLASLAATDMDTFRTRWLDLNQRVLDKSYARMGEPAPNFARGFSAIRRSFGEMRTLCGFLVEPVSVAHPSSLRGLIQHTLNRCTVDGQDPSDDEVDTIRTFLDTYTLDVSCATEIVKRIKTFAIERRRRTDPCERHLSIHVICGMDHVWGVYAVLRQLVATEKGVPLDAAVKVVLATGVYNRVPEKMACFDLHTLDFVDAPPVDDRRLTHSQWRWLGRDITSKVPHAGFPGRESGDTTTTRSGSSNSAHAASATSARAKRRRKKRKRTRRRESPRQ